MRTKYPPIPVTAYPKEDAPFVYTAKMEWVAQAHEGLEPRPAGTIARFGTEIMKEDCPVADAWLKAGYIERR